jgi:hypothetical protein
MGKYKLFICGERIKPLGEIRLATMKKNDATN